MLRRWQLDLLLSGWAIAAKSRTLKDEWSEHLAKTKKFISRSLVGDSELHVLGAGRLLDFPLEEILARYEKIHLYDADPGAIRYCKKIKKKHSRIELHLTELTGSLSKFKSILDEVNEIQDLITHTKFIQPTDICFGVESQIVSLNLLSQLPLAFRQILERWILKKYGRKYLKEKEAEWLLEYDKVAKLIIGGHIELLAKSSARKIILISDTEQLFYPLGTKNLPTPKELPFSWEVESKLETPLEVTSSICGLELANKLYELLPGYKATKREFWPWHLAPVHRKQNGIICRVEAFELIKT